MDPWLGVLGVCTCVRWGGIGEMLPVTVMHYADYVRHRVICVFMCDWAYVTGLLQLRGSCLPYHSLQQQDSDFQHHASLPSSHTNTCIHKEVPSSRAFVFFIIFSLKHLASCCLATYNFGRRDQSSFFFYHSSSLFHSYTPTHCHSHSYPHHNVTREEERYWLESQGQDPRFILYLNLFRIQMCLYMVNVAARSKGHSSPLFCFLCSKSHLVR